MRCSSRSRVRGIAAGPKCKDLDLDSSGQPVGFPVSSFPNLSVLLTRTGGLGNSAFPVSPPAPARRWERRPPWGGEASSRPRHSSLSISRHPARAVYNEVLRPRRRTRRPLSVCFIHEFFFFLADLGSGFYDQELGVKLAEKRELRLCSGRTERRAVRQGARLFGGLRRSPWTAALLAEAAAIAPPSIPHSTGGTHERGSPSPPAPQQPQPVRPAPPRAMAKEGVEKAEETEQMIEKEAGKEPAEGGGGGGSHRLGDAQEMRAVVLAGFGGLNKLRVTRKAMPEPQDGELKIRVKAWSSIRAFLAFFLSLSLRAQSSGGAAGRASAGTLPEGKSLPGRPPARPHRLSEPPPPPLGPPMLGRRLAGKPSLSPSQIWG